MKDHADHGTMGVGFGVSADVGPGCLCGFECGPFMLSLDVDLTVAW